ncbi:MAG: AAA family ATPase, partial [Candidatus Moranbacteria bacterium]|nr:AAA family ATPase [Candidatus Moranbacteria bacterium]
MQNLYNETPLADRMRPDNLADFFGQKELVGKNSFLRQAIKNDRVPSLILWGPPGSGKTTLAHIIAKITRSEFIQLSAVVSGKKDLKEIIEKAKFNKSYGKKTILFIDEIHRWNKAQQDALLPYVEKGTITMFGATTENPSFEVIGALLSRSRVFVLKRLGKASIKNIIQRALKDKERGLAGKKIKISDDTIKLISRLANGDARMALNTLEAAASQNS